MAWRSTKIKKCESCDVIHFSQGMNEYMEKYLSIHSFSIYGPCILERELWRKNKIIGIKRFKLLCKLTMANLCKIGLKVREWHFRERSSRIMSLTLLPPPPLPPPEITPLWCIFLALLAMNGPLPSELKLGITLL